MSKEINTGITRVKINDRYISGEKSFEIDEAGDVYITLCNYPKGSMWLIGISDAEIKISYEGQYLKLPGRYQFFGDVNIDGVHTKIKMKKQDNVSVNSRYYLEIIKKNIDRDIIKLEQFLKSDEIEQYSMTQISLINVQVETMKSYSQILAERISWGQEVEF